jgi:hypothetical protein
MHLKKQENGSIVFKLMPIEAELIRKCLNELIHLYHTPPSELNPKIDQVWYQTQNIRKSEVNSEHTEEWKQDLYLYKGEKTKWLEKWKVELTSDASPITWKIQAEEFDVLLTSLNDYRLLKTAEFDLSEEIMAQDIDEIKNAEEKFAVIEIHFLAWIIELLLAHQP